MELFDKLTDKLTDTKVISWRKMVEIVANVYIRGEDDKFLARVAKTAKGGEYFVPEKTLLSADQRYMLSVGKRPEFMFWLKQKPVTLYCGTGILRIEDKEWKDFYDAILTAVEEEKQKRG